jgi:xanthine dehydrogenase accessory factor
MAPRAAQLSRFLKQSDATIKIEVTEARGSTPREAGTWMLVSKSGIFGTIGGGQLEMMAINEARNQLVSGKATGSMAIPLGPEIGQCCGGNVALSLTRVDDAVSKSLLAERKERDAALPEVYVFGAGHVGKALAQALSHLPLNTVLVETRRVELDAATADVDKRLAAMPEAIIEDAKPGSAYVVLTHDHALDFLIVQTALARKDAAYVGMIGSKTKRASYVSWHVKEAGRERQECDRLICPIGGSAVRDKRPEVIAALTTAEIMTAVSEAG